MTDSITDFIPTAMSTSALENKLKDLKVKTNKHSQILTAKLSSSQSGQNLLHIGTSLQTLPPDLHSLLTQLHPVLSCAETAEKEYLKRLEKLVQCGNDIRFEERRVENTRECAGLYEDMLAAEKRLRSDPSRRKAITDLWLDDESSGKLDQIALLERCAQTTLFLVKELQSSTDVVAAMTAKNIISSSESSSKSLPSIRTPLHQDLERAQFVLKLAPRIRRLESDTISSLCFWTENTLKRFQDRKQSVKNPQSFEEKRDDNFETPSENELELMIGHCMRGLALLGRGKEVENIFARVAIMPLIRSKISIGRLDEGGPRGECYGLRSLLDDIVVAVATTFGPVLERAEVMFELGTDLEIDLITDGVWVPIVTALMADAGIKMAIFSPGIASILQSNYTVLDEFLSGLASRLLKHKDINCTREVSIPIEEESSIEKLYFIPTISEKSIRLAQERIYNHTKTAEFSKKWNLPIYYQLRFGDCCTRLNKAIAKTTQDGWAAEVFAGDTMTKSMLKNDVGFELSFFQELYDILLGLWKPDVILRPLTNRFLRGALQLIGRSVTFIDDGIDGKLTFDGNKGSQNDNDECEILGETISSKPFSWGKNALDVAAVAWELAILEASLLHDYVSTICEALSSGDTPNSELRSLVSEVLKEASNQIHPLVHRSWNQVIVKLLIDKCSGVLGAVKGVVATYRMTNRPPPTQASPYVKTILRPLREFIDEVSLQVPEHIGNQWKVAVITDITDRYAVAVEELITTVRRTEVALQNRRTRRVASGGVSDGDKVKLQLFLDFEAFCEDMKEVGVDPSIVEGVSKLKELTKEGGMLK
mmetsp:Transcript_13511/g.31764  ORF Transcript_13511/g.31764 Transcript_13511/m.31764 type:complete len:821 (-) Transcript_13511:438-2900(-)|eukprot:CAMPEP_0197188568 /NCGR_PEP_ID=MMETSP1423-20130617/18022_1 /TAXON_ID=476441 /ORGANISM="Pseudo-nitzschia heimii, Strain UNC1101" /LENGTH=820 /DNA_ID=CAMNT_0042640435 /DNA_START=51 /DNA_END=2513 /DNA_ORIENTATION=-